MTRLAIVLMLLGLACASAAKGGEADSLVMERVFSYEGSVKDTSGVGRRDTSAMYVRYSINTLRRNPALLCVPSMYVIAKGSREYAGERLSKVCTGGGDKTMVERVLDVGTIPRHRSTMPSLTEYITPYIYNECIVSNHMLSPFNRHNKGFYRYQTTLLSNGRVEIVFLPRLYNTQLISGRAIAQYDTGRITSVELYNEYDMIRLNMRIAMGDEGLLSLYPKQIDTNASFRFLGNKIQASMHSLYNLRYTLPDSVADSHDMALMQDARPEPLPEREQWIYDRADSLQAAADSAGTAGKKRSLWKTVLWDAIGYRLLNRIQGRFGANDQGFLRLSPILNPLYLGYSRTKGLTYKFKLRARYDFTANSNASLHVKGGYSFRQRQFYFNIPLRYTFDDRHNGFAEIEVGNGNRIVNSSIVEKIKNTSLDSINWDAMQLDYFRNMHARAYANYDFSDKFGIEAGMVFYRRSAVDKEAFTIAGQPDAYRTFAPTLKLQYRPCGWNGPAFTADYERGVKGVGNAGTEYERFEFDAQWICNFTKVRSLSLRAGSGFYTSRSDNAYFLDYSNFRDDNLVGGWYDDWTGDFHLLDRNWYNASEYYIRANATYESPLMAMSHIPYLGKFIETERIYISSLVVNHLHPYTELGYGFTTRMFSIGMFCDTHNWKLDGFGVKFGLELFSKW